MHAQQILVHLFKYHGKTRLTEYKVMTNEKLREPIDAIFKSEKGIRRLHFKKNSIIFEFSIKNMQLDIVEINNLLGMIFLHIYFQV